jgi:pSer/pThr/pTyr-binding forkhead associated (FHA) protein
LDEINHTHRTRLVGEQQRAIHLRQCKLVVLKGNQRGKEFVIAGDVIRIGKADGNDLVLTEDTVSRVHCEILRDARGHLLRDLGSTNGTFLDGAEVREAYVRAGSVITVGTVQIKFQPFEERIEILPSRSILRVHALLHPGWCLRSIRRIPAR